MDDGFPRTLLAIIFFIVGFCSCGALLSLSFEDYRAKAVERNAAEWILDTKTGKTTFTWKETEN